MEIYSDEQLMVKVKNGKLEMLTPLFDRYHKRLYNFFLKLTFSQDVSKDLVQNVFYRIIKYRKTYNAEYKFKTWMYQLARNIFSDHYRGQKAKFSDYSDVANIQVEDTDAVESIVKREKEKALHEALSRLPQEKREVLILSRFQGLKYDEIGKILNCSEGAVKVKVHRAIKHLKDAYFEIY
ncbi:RNA polymerase sigma factor [Fulvivirgaceae bacterium BMA10]|uniref:RNA polymerase sigma factor n=1 Tax=Splendidivirga corallicola TaxID=3051826 RepID=A0ABT8KMV4_9BACT|nr:RNA polymerase sigma factor [Fulvivirgaceae bacterium BMA10]